MAGRGTYVHNVNMIFKSVLQHVCTTRIAWSHFFLTFIVIYFLLFWFHFTFFLIKYLYILIEDCQKFKQKLHKKYWQSNTIITYKIINHEPVYRILGTDILLGGSSKGVAKVLAKHLLLLKLGISEGTYVTDVDIFYVADIFIYQK